MGRPPIGERAMTPAEKQRRYRERKFGNKSAAVNKPTVAALKQQLAQAHRRIAELERRGESQLTRSRRDQRDRPLEFSEVGKLRAEIRILKSDIAKLNMALQEEPDAKLRKKVVDQQVAMAGLRQELRRVAKERDQHQARVKAYSQLKHQEARQQLTGQNYRVIIKALHPDRAKQVTVAELAAAERLVTALRPLFDEG